MSYILDALKRSEADRERERERGTTPGVLAQTHRVIDPAEDEVPVVPPLKAGRLVALGLLLAGLLAGLGWWLWSPGPSSAQRPPSLAAPMPRPVEPAPAVVAGAAIVPPPPPSVAASDPAAGVPRAEPGQPPLPAAAAAGLDKPPAPPVGLSVPGAAAPAPLPAAVPVAPPAMPAAAVPPPVSDKPPSSPRKPESAPPTARTAPAPGGPAPGLAERAPAPEAAPPAAPAPKPGPQKLSQLPAELRRQLPPLKISGSVYSPDVPARMLILDGQVLREGQNAGPDLLIEQIGPKAAVLSFRGQRFELPYGP